MKKPCSESKISLVKVTFLTVLFDRRQKSTTHNIHIAMYGHYAFCCCSISLLCLQLVSLAFYVIWFLFRQTRRRTCSTIPFLATYCALLNIHSGWRIIENLLFFLWNKLVKYLNTMKSLNNFIRIA